MTIKDFIELAKALVPLAWPLILAIMLWKLFPAIKTIVGSPTFSIKVAGMEIGVQDATSQLSKQIEDLQTQVIELRRVSMPGAVISAAALPIQAPLSPANEPEGSEVSPSVTGAGGADRPARSLESGARRSKTILWVDDRPTNNAFEISQLENQGISVRQARSTEEAMSVLRQLAEVGAVISDMGRHENGIYDRHAGLTLLTALRQAGLHMPFLVYSSASHIRQNDKLVQAAGGDGATASAVELLEWIGSSFHKPHPEP
ncbi:response regulator [Sphingomonas sp. CGMCC 1.13654]|uniref:Response regulator n=1 Tax=Sphingomonas chungangi TaxID=2683589 RepID=A0A838L5V5_9SPHN|nr:response regulator [Sphingomonas chungangi]MBA2932968.1 response regulator [Sphingomonas chungangi]MVW56588.1 response regulator [Sphingomonas chungangi]